MPMFNTEECDESCTTGSCALSIYDGCSPLPTAQEQAQSQLNQTTADINKYKPTLKVCIGGACDIFESISCTAGQACPIPWLTKYIGVVYQYGVALAAVLATIMMMIGGFLWLTSGGSPNQIGKAKEFIVSAFTGLLLALFSFMILYTVNPEIVKLTPISVQTAAKFEVPAIVEADFGSGVQSEGAAGSVQGGQINTTSLAPTAQQGIATYGALGARETSGWRADGDGSRHQSGHAVDFAKNSELDNYIINNSQSTEQLSWGTAYHMPDGSVWVDENISVTGGTGPHWHTEFPDSEWKWKG